MVKQDKSDKLEQPIKEKTDVLPTSLALMFPEQQQRDFVNIITRLCTDESFREIFWKDPAQSLIKANLKADPEVVEILRKADRAIIDRIVRDSQDIISRSQAFTWEGEKVAFVPLIAAFFAGALAMRMYDDRW